MLGSAMVSGGARRGLALGRGGRHWARRHRLVLGSLLALIASGLAAVSVPGAAQAATTLPGFSETVVFSGLQNPTVVRFAPDGRVFVAEKSGVIKVFDSLVDQTPTVFADLGRQRPQLLGPWTARDGARPRVPDNPYVYVLYSYDHVLGSTSPAPRWGTPGRLLRPVPHAARSDRRRLRGERAAVPADGERGHDDRARAGARRGLVPAVPQPLGGFPGVRPDGALYASGGDGASFDFTRLRPGRITGQPLR